MKRRISPQTLYERGRPNVCVKHMPFLGLTLWTRNININLLVASTDIYLPKNGSFIP